MDKNKNALDFRKNENIVNISEASFGENMPKTNYIDAKNKQIVDAEKYKEGNKELNACYLEVCVYNKNNVVNEEKKKILFKIL